MDFMKKIFKIFIVGLFLITFNTVVKAGGPPPAPDCGNGPGVDCDVPIDSNVVILVVAGIAIGAFMLRNKLNTASFQA